MGILRSGKGSGNRSVRLRQAKEPLRLFRGRDDHVAVAQGDGFGPERLAAPLTSARLAGKRVPGRLALPGSRASSRTPTTSSARTTSPTVDGRRPTLLRTHPT
jgi:hypothetical protein